jgi:hypothetical protein
VRVVREAGVISIACDAGDRPAGVVLTIPPSRLPASADLTLAVRHSGGSLRASLAGIDEDAGSGSLLDAHPTGRSTGVEVPGGLLGKAAALVVQCPSSAVEASLHGVRLAPSRAAMPLPAAAWVWTTRWQGAPEQLVAAAKREGVARLFIALEIVNGIVRHDRALATFVARAHAAGIAVEAVEGDPRMVRADGKRSALLRARAIAAYQNSVDTGSKLDGVQYDIEPYLLAEYGADPSGVLTAWSGTLIELSHVIGEKLDVVVPFWLLSEDGGAEALAAVASRMRCLTVMAYRTGSGVVTSIAEPMLAWGAERLVPVRVALEAGHLDDEVEQVFTQADDGTLAVTSIGDEAVALRLRSGTRLAGATMLQLTGATNVAAANVSFLGDEQRLRRTASELQGLLHAWRSFAGLAFHGLLER